METIKRERESGIELLKIVAIFLIIISHVAQTVSTISLEANLSTDYYINLTSATTDIQVFVLALFRYFGPLGNAIFFVCSAWFLCDSKKASKEKILQMVIDTWTISIIFLVITYVLGTDVSLKYIIKSLLPTIFGNNWYVTCYLLFYSIHVYLNVIIEKMNQKTLLTVCIISAVLYCGICFFEPDVLFFSSFILFICIFLMINYMKKYMVNCSSDRKINNILLCIGCIGWIGIIAISNLIGLKWGFISNPLLRWLQNQNPFIIIMAVSMFNLFRQKIFVNSRINKIAGFSLLVYLFHENILFRDYFRPYVFKYVYDEFGYAHIIVWVLLISVLLFFSSVIVSQLYCFIIRNKTKKLQKIICKIGTKWYEVVTELIMRLE